jgi:hypothetical protein
MIVLGNTTDLIQIVTSAANALDVHASYVGNTTSSYTPTAQNTLITTATTTTVLSSPPANTQRGLKKLTANARGGANTVTVNFFDGTSTYRLISVALLANETLEYEDGGTGWGVKNADGAVKLSGPTGATGATGATGPAPTGVIQSHLNWTPSPSATGNLLTLLAAGHAPGLYRIECFVLVRTNAGGNSAITATVNFTTPIAGAISPSIMQTGTGAQVTSQVGMARFTISTTNMPFETTPGMAVVSTGATDLTVQFVANAVSAVAVIDVYAVATLVGV